MRLTICQSVDCKIKVSGRVHDIKQYGFNVIIAESFAAIKQRLLSGLDSQAAEPPASAATYRPVTA